jgi:hypothetical protein
VYIQDVVLPQDLVKVLTEREIANQEVRTYKMQQTAQQERVNVEKAKGTADMQADLARSAVGVDIKTNNALSRAREAEGEATYIEKTGAARGAQVRAEGLAHAEAVRAEGLARAEAYERQVMALGQRATALVNAVGALAAGKVPFVPQILVTGSNGGSGAIDGLAATLMQWIESQKGPELPRAA